MAWPLGKEEGSLLGGVGWGACARQGAQHDQGRPQAGFAPRHVLCPGRFALRAGRLCSSVNRHTQKVSPEPDGLCLVKTTVSEANGKQAGCWPKAAPAQLGLRPLGTQPPRHSIVFGTMAEHTSTNSKSYSLGGTVGA